MSHAFEALSNQPCIEYVPEPAIVEWYASRHIALALAVQVPRILFGKGTRPTQASRSDGTAPYKAAAIWTCGKRNRAFDVEYQAEFAPLLLESFWLAPVACSASPTVQGAHSSYEMID
jgi:hypothetical protein